MPLSNDQCVLVVEELPPYFPGLEEALVEYMKNTGKTQVQPIISCEIENGKAYIKFNNSSGEETYCFSYILLSLTLAVTAWTRVIVICVCA